MNVIITEAAYDDLLQIGRTIKHDNPVRAESFVAVLFDRCQSLGDMPRAYPLLDHWANKDIRKRVYGNYLIFYRSYKETIEVLHILHGATNYEPMLFPEG